MHEMIDILKKKRISRYKFSSLFTTACVIYITDSFKREESNDGFLNLDCKISNEENLLLLYLYGFFLEALAVNGTRRCWSKCLRQIPVYRNKNCNYRNFQIYHAMDDNYFF